MRSSRLAAALLAAVWGCSHSVATPPHPTAPAPVLGSASTPRGAAPSGPSASAAASPVGLDPSEAITPRELASIPDPIPGGPGRGAIGNATQGDSGIAIDVPAAGSSVESRAPVGGSSAESRVPAIPPAESGDERHGVWRVQVFASPDLQQADRIAKEASSHFGVPSVIEFEGSLYKVRLGAFASEALAQTLRERAVQEGFPGAFRMRSPEPVSSTSK